MRKTPLAALAVMAFAVSTAAYAGDADKEAAVAAQHAGFASMSETLVGAQAHLHHVVNCLVGPGGQGFDPKELNPCGAIGSGAIPDTQDESKKTILEEALAAAMKGLATNDHYEAVKAAKETQELLERVH